MSEMVAFGKFRIVSKLGTRGAWSVFEAVEVALERPVELRAYGNRLPRDSPHEQAFLQRLMRIAAVDHPTLMAVLDFNIVMEKGYYTTSPRDSITIAEAFALRDLDMLDEAVRLQLAIDLARGLDALHEGGIAHGAIGPDTVLWDRKRHFAYFGWVPIIEPSPREFGAEGPALPPGYHGKAADLFRLAGLVHQMVSGTAPLAEPPAGTATAAVNVPGMIDGAFEVMERALPVDPSQAMARPADLAQGLERVLAKQRVRAELEKSVSSMVIPQEMLEAALARKKEQKRRRVQKGDVSASELPYLSPLETIPGGARTLGAAALGLVVLIGAVFTSMGGSTGTLPPPTTPATTSRPPPTARPATSTPATPGATPSATAKPAAGAGGTIGSLKGAPPTDKENFLDRWGTLKTWVLALPPAKRRNLFTYGKLVQLRSEFKRDEAAACRELDDLIKQAVAEE